VLRSLLAERKRGIRADVTAERACRSAPAKGGRPARLPPVEQAREPAPLRGGDVSGDHLRDDAAGIDLETGGLDLLQLVIGRAMMMWLRK
jgi:hypothetical protein